MLGAHSGATAVAQVETIENVLSEQLSARHRGALEANKPALKRGYL
jgi:hypothetical protein